MVKLQPHNLDRIFLGFTIVLILFGALAFVSASLSVLAENPSFFYKALFSQLILGVGFGSIAMYFLSRLDYHILQKFAPWIFLLGLFITLLVFVPGLTLEHGGAKRWISLGFISFQPSEFLKLSFVLYLSAWLSSEKPSFNHWKKSLLPFSIFLVIPALVLLAQPDTDSLLIITAAALAMYFIAGAKWRHIGLFVLSLLIGLAILVATRPYLLDRIKTFVDPSIDPLGSSYQITQSVMSVGSGQITGRGFGQSIQKFNYLPEPTGDSIFAIISEEFGFLGSLTLVILYLGFVVRGLRISMRAPDKFGSLLALGFVTLIGAQSFLNIMAIIGIFPLTGLPLIFVSHGGTALFLALCSVGIILNISRYQRVR